jgi:hypothetical protein
MGDSDEPASAGSVTRTCSVCGAAASAPEGGLPAGWSIGVDDRGRTTFTCVACARQHIRAIEGKLPEEWW